MNYKKVFLILLFFILSFNYIYGQEQYEFEPYEFEEYEFQEYDAVGEFRVAKPCAPFTNEYQRQPDKYFAESLGGGYPGIKCGPVSYASTFSEVCPNGIEQYNPESPNLCGPEKVIKMPLVHCVFTDDGKIEVCDSTILVPSTKVLNACNGFPEEPGDFCTLCVYNLACDCDPSTEAPDCRNCSPDIVTKSLPHAYYLACWTHSVDNADDVHQQDCSCIDESLPKCDFCEELDNATSDNSDIIEDSISIEVIDNNTDNETIEDQTSGVYDCYYVPQNIVNSNSIINNCTNNNGIYTCLGLVNAVCPVK